MLLPGGSSSVFSSASAAACPAASKSVMMATRRSVSIGRSENWRMSSRIGSMPILAVLIILPLITGASMRTSGCLAAKMSVQLRH